MVTFDRMNSVPEENENRKPLNPCLVLEGQYIIQKQ